MSESNWMVGSVNGALVRYRVVPKGSSILMKVISWCLFWQRKTFMDDYFTTIGRTIYTPQENPPREVMEHELIHVHDYQKYHVWFVFSYLFCLPMLLTMRAHWERRAYSWNIRKHGWANVPWLQHQFCSATYLWMWPSKKGVENWVNDCAEGRYAPITEVTLDVNAK